LTKSRGIGRGGARPNAGRRRGGKNRHRFLAEILPKVEAEDLELPLYRLLRRQADPELDERYRDALAIATLPFMHPKPPSTLTCKPPFLMSDQELRDTYAAEAGELLCTIRQNGSAPAVAAPRC
jgi:hypothetical protein